MTDKELIRRALLGDKRAQQECTNNGIALPSMLWGPSERRRYPCACTPDRDVT